MGNSNGLKEAQKLLEKHDPQYQQWKEEAKKKERDVELQEQAEVLAKAMKEQFDQTMSALAIPHYATAVSSQSSWCSKRAPLLQRREEDKINRWGRRLNFAESKRNCCTRSALVGTG